MSTIIAVYTKQPSFPPEDQQPDAVRTQLGTMWVDSTGGAATQAELDAFIGSGTSDFNRRSAIYTDTGFTDLLNRLQTSSSTQIDTWIDNNVGNLAQARTVLKQIVKLLVLLYTGPVNR